MLLQVVVLLLYTIGTHQQAADAILRGNSRQRQQSTNALDLIIKQHTWHVLHIV